MRRTASLVAIVVGIVMAVAGIATWVVVSNTLSEQKIVVSDDANCLAGDEVNGPVARTLGWAYFVLICLLAVAAPVLFIATNGGG